MIINGKDLDFGQSSSGLPTVDSAIANLFQPVTIGIISSSQVNGYTQTLVEKYLNIKAVRIQNPNSVVTTKTGERIWNTCDIYFPTSIVLNIDDLFLFQDVQYRVVLTEEWTEYGYNKYAVTQDFTKLYTQGSGVI